MVSRYVKFVLAISAINRYIQKIEKTAMAKYGLKGSHAQCLIAMAGNPSGITAAELCRFCDKDKAAISRTVAELEAAGYVDRRGEGENMYRAVLTLTQEGKNLATELSGLAAKAVKAADEGITDDDLQAFYKTVNTFAKNLSMLSRNGIK